MDRFQAMQTFAHVVEQASFSKASLVMGVATPTVSRQVAFLEGHLGVSLLNRTTRHLSLTPDGLHYFEYCKRILGEVHLAETTLPGTTQTPRGRLRVDISHALARQLILPAVSEFLERYPQIQLTIGLDDRVVDLLHENIDCAIRTGVPQDSQVLIARRVASFEWVTCATPAYLEKHGTPTRLSDLAQHRAVGYFHPQSGKNLEWTFMSNGESVSVQMNHSISVNETAAYVTCGLESLGLIRVASYLVRDHVQAGRLVPLLQQFNAPSDPVSVVYPKGNRSSLIVRTFVDWVAEVFAKDERRAQASSAQRMDRTG